MAEEGKGFTAKHLRWVVVGVLGVTFMLVFKDEISDKIKGADKISIGTEGISIETKTTNTPLGETIVSGPVTLDTAGVTPASAPSLRSNRGYAINWPQDGSWSPRPQLAQAMGLDFVIAYNRSWGNFVPNVNVTIEPAQGFSIRGWMENSNPIIRAYGFELTDVQIDDASNTGVRVMRGNYGGMIADQIQRVIISDGQAYIATATRPVGFEADPNLWANLNQILNSFRLG